MRAEYIDRPNDDLKVVNSARVSFDKESEWEYAPNPDDFYDCQGSALANRDRRLINYLANHGHWTPFSHVRETFILAYPLDFTRLSETDIAGMVWDGATKVRHSLWGWANLINQNKLSEADQTGICIQLFRLYPVCAATLMTLPDEVTYNRPNIRIPQGRDTDPRFLDVTMRETIPIFVARQRFKHMVGFTYNEVSRRYVDDPPEFFIPERWRSRPEGSVKQGSGSEAITHVQDHDDTLRIEVWYEDHLEYTRRLYASMLDAGVAPEQARMVLPQSMYTSYYVTGSLAAWARAYKQRADSHAQQEIQGLAEQWGEIIEPLFPVSWAALVQGD